MRNKTSVALLATAAAVLLAVSGCAAGRIGQAVELARSSVPLQRTPECTAMRLLIVGDSTAVGTGVASAQASLAGLLARHRADLLALMPAGNVGNAPFFFAPLSWLMTRRSRQLHSFVREAAARHAALCVNLFHERADDPFVNQPGLHARDGLHPSDTGYRVWFSELSIQADLARRLAPAT